MTVKMRGLDREGPWQYNPAMVYGRMIFDREPAPGSRLSIDGPMMESLLAWRPRLKDAVTVSGPSGLGYRARVTALFEDRAELEVFEAMAGRAEPGVGIILLQALPDKERMEYVIEKCTELGVSEIAPWEAENGISLSAREARQPKAHAWQERARRAARQCRRGGIPEVRPVSNLAESLARASGAALKIALCETGGEPIREAVEGSGADMVAVLVGPEGGFSKVELAAAAENGFVMVSMGPRILRTETAAIAATALVAFLGEGGGNGPIFRESGK